MSKPDRIQIRHCWLSWEILRNKVLYYRPSNKYVKARSKMITDDEYDTLEKEYLNLCEVLDKPNTLVHKSYCGIDVKGMMELDMDRPSVKYMIRYLRGDI